MKLIILSFFILSSCALMSQKDCQIANWQGLGHGDALEGKTTQQFYKREEACIEHGIKADQKKYHYGYKIGLKRYCTYENGVIQGEEEKSYHNICSGTAQRDFLRGYELGQKNRHIKTLQAAAEQKEQLRQQHYNGGIECTTKFDCDDHNKCVNDFCSLTGESCFSDFSCSSDTECKNSRCTY